MMRPAWCCQKLQLPNRSSILDHSAIFIASAKWSLSAVCWRSYSFIIGGDFVGLVLTGKYFDPDYGYVDITTPTPLKIYYVDVFPTEGIIILDGANGLVGGNTKARFTAINDTSYMVEADTTGDGAYDYNSGATSW